MPARYVAAVTCPSCGTRFQAPVEQVIDVRVDPTAKSRVLSGTVNVAMCPACGTGGSLNLPFIYHDPDEEIALLYLPVEAGSNEVERQKVAGRLTRQLMDAMPPEERKGYLLQPETFISMETLIKRVLELEGISEEDMERGQRQRAFFAELVQADEEQWSEMLSENAELVDEGLFAFAEYVMQLLASGAQLDVDAEKLEALHEHLVENTKLGQELAKRSEVIRDFVEDPTRDSLLHALTEAPDEETVSILVRSGLPLMDYGFFQQLNQRIEEAESAELEGELRALRRTILDLRDRLVEESEEAVRERARLLNSLVMTEDPQRMASSHLSELDELFFTVLGTRLQEAQDEGDEEALEALERVATAVNRVIESTMPPEIALIRRLVAVSDDELDQALRANRKQLTPRFLQFVEALEQSMEEQGQDEAAAQLAKIRDRARQIAPAQRPAAAAQKPDVEGDEQKPADTEERTPSGLIIAKR